MYTMDLYEYKGGYSFILFWLMNCFASDSGGLILGNRFGVAKFCKSISPGKTWVGVIGSILGA
jgi:CDP-diglyceride synthetase